jgi:hypothetical protein
VHLEPKRIGRTIASECNRRGEDAKSEDGSATVEAKA